jgi:hypothetical protein
MPLPSPGFPDFTSPAPLPGLSEAQATVQDQPANDTAAYTEELPAPSSDLKWVRDLMGRPTKIDPLSDGHEEWHYCTLDKDSGQYVSRLIRFKDGRLLEILSDSGAEHAVCMLKNQSGT